MNERSKNIQLDDIFKKARKIEADDFLIMVQGNYGSAADKTQNLERIKIISSDETPEDFFKLLLNLMLQEQFKPQKDGGYISFDVIYKVFKRNIKHPYDFSLESFDYNRLLDIKPEAITTDVDIITGERIKKQADKVLQKDNELTKYGELGNILMLFGTDNQLWQIFDNEYRTPKLGFEFMMLGCKKYHLNPLRVLRYVKQVAETLQAETIARKEFDDCKLVLYKNASGLRRDFDRSVEETKRTLKVTSTINNKMLYKYAFCDFFLTTPNTNFTFATLQDENDTIGYLCDVLNVLNDKPLYDSNTVDHSNVSKVLEAFQERKPKFKDPQILDFINTVKLNGFVESPELKGGFDLLADDSRAKDISQIVLDLAQEGIIIACNFMWHGNRDADINAQGVVSDDFNDFQNMAILLFQQLYCLSILYPNLRKQFMDFDLTYHKWAN